MGSRRLGLLLGAGFIAAGAFSQLILPGAKAQTPQAGEIDLIIRNGTIYPGGAAPFRGDVAISGDKIVYVGPHAPASAKRVIDASGMIVAPGFIDTHTHVDDALTSELPAARLVLPFLTQGVTTAFIGVDGVGNPAIADSFGKGVNRDSGINYASYVGFGAVRLQVIGAADRQPTPQELGKMQNLVAGAMCEGALGLSTGLFYAPQSFAKLDEVVALSRIAAARGGVYDSHLRDESSYTIGLSGAVDEALEIGKQAQIPVHIAHIKALGVDVQGQAGVIIEKIEAARRAGQIVHADQYPWSASGTGLSAALLPRWAQDGGRAATLARFDDPAQMAKILPAMADNLRRRGGPASILITQGPAETIGKTLEQISKETGADPVATAVAILRRNEAGIASFNQSDADIAALMKRPWVVTSSDASEGHPRYYASFARKYSVYVKEKKVIDLRTFIDQSTAVTADLFSLTGRGHLKAGAFADVVVFDPARYGPRADYVHPALFSQGMRTVLVNGKIAIDDGAPTGIAAGRPLPRTPKAGSCR
ncbi:MAG: amidohydrolase family protein [Candidatus Sphingomonas colombiensis]|nr:amidohydrolase family protein [Sphingomonas sp.]WEK42891.1 MAG: amidohydrolase family protein [Sphingomonas sp.]